MSRRPHLGIWLSVLLASIVIGLTIVATPSLAHSQAQFDVIINEWSQGNGGNKEWVELLVVEGPADLRGWDLGDSTPGDLSFSNNALWSNVPAGTLIVIYNNADRDSSLPPDDFDPVDFTLIVPDDSDTFFSSGNWSNYSNSTNADNPVLRDSADNIVHNYSVQPGTSSTLHPDSNEHVAFTGSSISQLASSDSWAKATASVSSPASANGGANTTWVNALQSGLTNFVDLQLSLEAPSTAQSRTFDYILSIENSGNAPAANVVVTQTLDVGLHYISNASGLVPALLNDTTILWQVGSISPNSTQTITVSVEADPTTNESLSSTVEVGGDSAELTLLNNTDTKTTLVGTVILINAVHYDGHSSSSDEAVQLINLSNSDIDLTGWQLTDGVTSATFGVSTTIEANQKSWFANDANSFTVQFGHAPNYDNTSYSGSWPGYANTGDEVQLYNPNGALIDTVVYGSGATTALGWSGAAVQPYTDGTLGTKGQILYRMRDQISGLPVVDTNSEKDWAQSTQDVINGRKVLYPGWDLDDFFQTAKSTEASTVKISIAPDNSFSTVKAEIDAATSDIKISSLIFTNLRLMNALVAAVERGVDVDLLLEGSPAGGIRDQELYLCQLLETAGGNCWFSINDTTSGAAIYDRYRFMHAKYMIIDGSKALIGSDNFTGSSMPYDDFSDGTSGRRGTLVVTNATSVVDHVNAIWKADFDAAHHREIFGWTANDATYGNRYGAPPNDFIVDDISGGITYTVRYPTANTFVGTFEYELVQSPENSLRTKDGLLGLVGQASAGDTLYVQQLNERPYWGASSSNAINDPNPRLEAYLDAARRGAEVWIMLDRYHVENFYNPDDPPDNFKTCQYAIETARAEGFEMRCTLALPADLGIHNKMVLANISGVGYVHIGSINGTEMSSKGNRELAIQFQSNDAYAYLAEMFVADWPHQIYLPYVGREVLGPARYPLISEVLYDPSGLDEAEFIEIANPTSTAIDISQYSLGDAVSTDDFEDVKLFPDGTVLPPKATVVVAYHGNAFIELFGVTPDFEIVNSSPTIPNMIDDPAYDSEAALQLGNLGDEVIFRDVAGNIVDVVTYGTGAFEGVIGAPPVSSANHSLERYPYWRDTDDGSADFRESIFPSPGELP